MVIAQPERVLLHAQMVRYGSLLRGELLDVGSGRFNRYRVCCPNATSWKTLDVDDRWKPDYVGSVESMPLPDASVDSVLCTQVLEHVAHPVQAVAEIFRVLKPGGAALITVPQWNELHEEPHDYFRYTKFGLTVLLEDAGFRIEALDQRGGYHSVLAQTIIRRWLDRYRPYERKTMGYAFFLPCALLTKWAVWRDEHDRSEASRKHAIGWCVVVRKP